jgi:hypothetical protein
MGYSKYGATVTQSYKIPNRKKIKAWNSTRIRIYTKHGKLTQH